ncbi:hypothetical protein BPC006_I0341 [Burkholderia pseudomallei BPC006]|nr:hypothetical protein BPC006_I0341 [Burkholderia pseudomallei BPC006]
MSPESSPRARRMREVRRVAAPSRTRVARSICYGSVVPTARSRRINTNGRAIIGALRRTRCGEAVE